MKGINKMQAADVVLLMKSIQTNHSSGHPYRCECIAFVIASRSEFRVKGLLVTTIHPVGLLPGAAHQVAKAGEQDDRLVRIDFLDLAGEHVAIHFRHGAVREDEVKCAGPVFFQAFAAVEAVWMMWLSSRR